MGIRKRPRYSAASVSISLKFGYLDGPQSSCNGDVAILQDAANLRFALAFKTGFTYVFFETFWLVAIF